MAAVLIKESHQKASSLENLRVLGGQNARSQSISGEPSASRPMLHTSQNFGGSNDNGVNLIGYRQIATNVTNNTRWHSDTNLAANPYHSESTLSVNTTEVDVNEEDASVTIYWDIKANVSAKDWIGLYKTDQAHPGKWLDYRNRGVSGSKKGDLVWPFNRIASAFTEPETRICFRYYHGNTGDLRAVTEPILVRNSLVSSSANGLRRIISVDSEAEILHLAIQDMEATHVRKGMFFNPDPYVKIRIEPGQDMSQPVLSHHYKDSRTSVCENTTEPRWHNEIFHFMALPSDTLFMKVKDRFTTARPTLLRFLGQISLPMKQVMEKAKLGLSVSCQLIGRTPHDHVCGSLTFKPTIIPHDASRHSLNVNHLGEIGGSCCGITDSSVESALDRSSADILSDSSENSDSEPADIPTVRELTHSNSGTSGDSCMDIHPAGMDPNPSFLVSQAVDSLATQSEATDSTSCALPSIGSDDPDMSDSITRSFLDPFAVYQLEEGAVETSDQASLVAAETLDDIGGSSSTLNSTTLGLGPEGHSHCDSVNSDAIVKGEDNSSAGSNNEVTDNSYAASSSVELDNANVTENLSESELNQPAIEGCSSLETDTHDVQKDQGDRQGQESTEDIDSSPSESTEVALSPLSESTEVALSLPSKSTEDVPVPSESTGAHSLPSETAKDDDSPLSERMTRDSSVSPERADDSLVVRPLEEGAAAAAILPIPGHSLLKAGGENSASDWSLENHAGSQENIFDEEASAAEANYQNLSKLVSKAKPATPEADSRAKDKPPLPVPRNKTLAEQLQNLPVIESEAFHRQNLPPDLPQKTKEVTTSAHSEASSKRRALESEGSLEMPTAQAPVPPGGARPKKPIVNHHQQVAEQYGRLGDSVDAKPKKVTTKEEPPLLQPRKPRTELPPPRLPPRNRSKADVQSQSQDLDEVFEPSLSSRQRPARHHKAKARSGAATGTESEEARVAAEVANAAASLTRPNRMKSESIEVEEALPEGWEARVDAHGRVFYIDHNNRSTTWERPTSSNRGPATPHTRLQRVPSISNTDRVNMDNRYRIVKRMSSIDTINEGGSSPPKHHAPLPPSATRPPTSQPSSTQEPQASAATESTAANTTVSEGAAASTPSTSQSSSTNSGAASTSDAETRLKQEIIRNSPAVKFLTRTDFFSLVQYSDEAQTCYTGNSALKHMVHKIRKDPMNFHKYWHNKDLVNFLNMFVNKEEELPGSWQMKHDKTGKVFFLDHNTKTTTFIDPRLPTVQPALNPGTQMPLPRNKYRTDGGGDSSEGASNLPTAYDEKVVIFLRQPNVLTLLQDKYPLLKKNESLKNKINTIIADGSLALKKYRNHVELTIVLSMFENEIMSYVPAHLRNPHDSHQTSPKGSPAPARRMEAPLYKRDFQEKYRTFLRKVEAKGIGQGPGKTKMRVQRDHILEDSFKKIMSYSKKDLQRNKLLISFLGEEGLDYGGPAREFFFLLSRELFNPYYGLFEYSANDTYTVQISAMSTFVDNAAEWFRFAGRMIGLCIVHQYLMDSFFTRPFYKMLLRESCVLSDLESLDAEFHRSLLWIKDNDISEAGLDLTFSVDEEVFGQVTERELKPNGMNIPVTNRNKKEYIEKMVSWRIDRGVNEQKEHLLKGFHEVIEPKLVSIFDAKDLELVIAGTAEIDIVDWRNNTEYRSGYYDTHPLVDWFWQVIERFDNEKRLRLLQFVTGTSSIPFEGFSALRGSNGPRKFTIEKWGTPESLPRAHTCFNRLDLPTYTSKETMQEKLLLAISETSTFGIE